MSIDGLPRMPRRSRMDQWTTAESLIQYAVNEVEGIGAHPLLTEAVILLGKAREKVADFVDLPMAPAPPPATQLPHPTPGRIVHYRLSADDVKAINRRRTSSKAIAERIPDGKWPLGAQAHIGNEAREGDYVPMMVIRMWDANPGVVNGQAFLDGNDTLWVTSAKLGEGNGEWCWPPRV